MSLRDSLLHAAKWATTAVLGFWMTIPESITLLMGFVFADFITGLASAFVNKKVDSSVGTRGGVKKMAIIFFVFMMYRTEEALQLNVHAGKWLAAYFIILEVVSIIENCSYIGVPIPAVIVEALVKVKKLTPKSMSIGDVEHAFHPELPNAPAACVEKNDCQWLTPGGHCTLVGPCKYKPGMDQPKQDARRSVPSEGFLAANEKRTGEIPSEQLESGIQESHEASGQEDTHALPTRKT